MLNIDGLSRWSNRTISTKPSFNPKNNAGIRKKSTICCIFMIYLLPLHKTFKPMPHSVDQICFITLNVGFARHQADWNWKDVRNPFARLYLVTEGTAQLFINGQPIKLTPQQYRVKPF